MAMPRTSASGTPTASETPTDY
ncbi:MAG: hypothetical protein QOI13_3069, partial [Paraburkholderia sp.]|nr:hypothetical protein [Paraburkholderia sp.]